MIGSSGIIFTNEYASPNESRNELVIHRKLHEEQVAKLTALCKRRFLTLESIDVGQCDWRVINDRGEKIYPNYKAGESLAGVRGFLASNPQA